MPMGSMASLLKYSVLLGNATKATWSFSNRLTADRVATQNAQETFATNLLGPTLCLGRGEGSQVACCPKAKDKVEDSLSLLFHGRNCIFVHQLL